jgi:hypothetical protein
VGVLMVFFTSFPKTQIDLLGDGQIYNIKNTFRYAKIPDKFINNYLAYTKYNIIDGERPDVVSTKLYGTPNYYWTFFVVNDFLKNSFSNWALSSYKLQEYIKLYMMDTVINMRPRYVIDPDGILIRVENSVVGNFDVVNQEPVLGYLSGATGNIVDVDPAMQQIRITNVDGIFQPNELIIGNNTQDTIISYEVFKLYNAPCEYRDDGGNVVNNLLFFSGGVPNTNITTVTYYEKIQEENDRKSNITVISPSYITEFVKQYKRIVA